MAALVVTVAGLGTVSSRIGSELCRQLSQHTSAGLLRLELSEFILYRLKLGLSKDRPPPALALLISDVKTVAQLRQIVIGAIKRASEMVILTLTWHHPAKKSIAVHFGNVMSSNGSLIPKFKKHPLEGGQPF